MRARTLGTSLVITLGVAVVAATASASVAAGDPIGLILKKSDFPAGTMYEADDSDYPLYKDRLDAAGVSFESATFQAISSSSTKGSTQVTGSVLVTPSVAQAKKGFTLMKSPKEFWWASTKRPLTLPSYGDQQHALHDPAGGEGIWIAHLVVRKRATLWALRVIHERRPAISKAEFLASVKTYARKQRARVGAG